MPSLDERYPALVERALRAVAERGVPVDEGELCRELFGAAGGPWPGLLRRVLETDGRLQRRDDGRWATPTTLRETTPEYASRHEPVGLVVLATGPKPWRHPIVGLAAARKRPDGDAVVFETLVRPAEPVRVPAYVARLGVDPDGLDSAPPLDRALDQLLAFVGDSPLVGLDAGIAVARLQFALRQVGRPPLDNGFVELAVASDSRPDVAALARRAGVPVPQRPTPGKLAELALRLSTLVEAQEPAGALGATAWRRLLDARILGEIPSAPGVYLFRDRAERLLYVGKATSLRARLSSYLTGSFSLVRSMPGLVESTARLEVATAACELAARMREAELIALHRPPYNVQRSVEPQMAWAALEAEEPTGSDAGVPRLRLRLADVPTANAVLASVSAARAIYRRLRASWWPARARKALRPSADVVQAQLAALSEQFQAEVAAVEVAPGLRTRDLANLIVVAPTVPLRTTSGPDAEDEGSWTRERRDAEWPPRVVDWIEPQDVLPPAEPEPTGDVEIAVEAARTHPHSLSVVLAALRRREPGVRAVPG